MAAMPGKAGLSRLVGGPVTLAPLAAELMEAPKLREAASASLLSPLGRVWALGLFLAVGERWGDGIWSPSSWRDVWERDRAELVQKASERLGACWGRGLVRWHLLILIPLGKEPTLSSCSLGWICAGGCAESPQGCHAIS